MGSLTLLKGNLFDSKCQTLVNTVNCQGIMGAGIALEFKKRYPRMFESYERCCSNGLVPGKLQVYKGYKNKIILNFPTKDRVSCKSKKYYIEDGLIKFTQIYQTNGIESIAFPALGCNNGGLSFKTIKPLMLKYLEPLSNFIDIEIYLPIEE